MTAKSTAARTKYGPRGNLHVDKICMSESEAWGLLCDEMGRAVSTLKRLGFKCRRVEIALK